MFDELKKDWQILKSEAPGRRFEERYRYRRYEAPSPPAWRIAKIVVGALLIPVGIALWFLPGPGWLTIIAGLALLAGQSRWTSRLLDGAEVRIRRLYEKFRDRKSRGRNS